MKEIKRIAVKVVDTTTGQEIPDEKAKPVLKATFEEYMIRRLHDSGAMSEKDIVEKLGCKPQFVKKILHTGVFSASEEEWRKLEESVKNK